MNVKILVLGGPGAGKTCIVNRFTNDTFLPTKPTIAIDLATKEITREDGQTYFIQLWDVGGADRSAGLSKMFCRGAHGAVVVADVTDDTSL